jgi:hypothetical protein
MKEKGKQTNYLSLLLNVYVLLVGVGVPLVVKDKYFDILVIKYYYYCICTIFLVISVIIYAVLVQRKSIASYIKKNTIKTVLSKLSISDYGVILFWIIAVISTLTSGYLYESFWGNEGRFTGLFLINWYVLSYFCISRLWKFQEIFIDVILSAGTFVCLFGITDYFNMDIFKFKVPMLPEQRAIFTSTIGNINTYTAYVGIIVAISTVLFALNKELKRSVFYYLCMIISFFAIIMGVSDNAYLSLAALFAILPLFLFNNKAGIQKYLIIIASFFSVIQCIRWINLVFGNSVLGIDSVFNMLMNLGGLRILVIALWIIIITWKFIDIKSIKQEKEYGNVFKYIWLFMLSIVLMVVIYIIFDINVQGSVRYGSLSTYFMFNDDWGTHRGYIWRNALENFSKLSIWKKVFGFGPETFGIFLLQKTAHNPYNELFDSAHNEYLHLLITVGISGLLAYLLFIADYVKKCLCGKKRNPYTIAVAIGVVCYSAQAFVNLNLPITTPIFWLLMGIGASKSNEK